MDAAWMEYRLKGCGWVYYDDYINLLDMHGFIDVLNKITQQGEKT